MFTPALGRYDRHVSHMPSCFNRFWTFFIVFLNCILFSWSFTGTTDVEFNAG